MKCVYRPIYGSLTQRKYEKKSGRGKMTRLKIDLKPKL